jgi:hypothetical protein
MKPFTRTRRHFISGIPALGLIAASAAEEQPIRDILFGSCLDTHEHPMLDQTLSLRAICSSSWETTYTRIKAVSR